MKFSKEWLLERFKDVPPVLERLNKINDDTVCLEFMSRTAWKTQRQNRLFHALLTLFWESGCSSYLSYDDMRLCYKRMIGLVKRKEGMIVESSWSEATKEQAQHAIDNILRDMDMSGVIASSQGKRYENILKTINQIN